jgi:hypothetical protein
MDSGVVRARHDVVDVAAAMSSARQDGSERG